MSRNMDERVVSMKFDNSDFEKNVGQSMSTLEKLKNSLKLTESSKGLTELGDTANKMDFSGLENGVEAVRLKFSAMQIMGVTALANITNSLINTGKQLTNSILAPMKAGGKNRALNIEQAEFQFKGLGMNVEKTMEDANYAVDGTAYSLDAAATVAAQFGASGMRAGKQMRSSLRAISGVAAMTGSSYEDIGRVFTKVAGQGRVMGDDLLSLSSRGVNAAATMGKAMNKSEADIREMVSAGDIGFKEFSAAMDEAFGEHAKAANKTFTGSLSNMKAALSRIGEKFYTPFHRNMIDPLNTVRAIINNISKELDPAFKVLEKFMDKLSEGFVKQFKDFDVSWVGDIVTGLINISKYIGEIGKPLKEAFRDIFPKTEGNKLADMMQKFAEFTKALKLSDDNAKKLKSTFSGLFAVLDIIGVGFKEVWTAAGQLLGKITPLRGGILDLTAKFGDYLVGVRKTVRENGLFQSSFDKVKEVVGKVSDKIHEYQDRASVLWEKVSGFKIELGGWDGFVEFLGKVKDLSVDAGKAIWEFLGKTKDTISEVFKSDTMDFVSAGLLAGIVKLIDTIANKIQGFDLTLGSFDKIKTMMGSLQTTLEGYQNKLRADTLKSIAIAIGILAGSILVLSMVDTDKLIKATAAMGGLMAMLTKMSKALSGIESPQKSARTISTMIGAVTSLLILSAAVKVLSTIDTDDMIRAISGMTAMMVVLVGAMKFMAADKKDVVKGSGQMILMAGAILAMVAPIKLLGSMDAESMGRGLSGVLVLLGSLTTAMLLLGNVGKGGATAVKNIGQLVLMAGAIAILAKVMQDLSKMDLDAMGVAALGISGMLTGLVVAMEILGKFKAGNAKNAGQMVIMASALFILGEELQRLSSLTWSEMAVGLTGITVALGVLVGAMKILEVGDTSSPSMKNITGLVVAATSLLMVGNVVKKLAELEWSELARGLTGIVVSMTTLVAALKIMEGASSMKSSASLVVAATSMLILGQAIKKIGELSVGSIAKGLISIAGAFAILGIAGKVLEPVIPSLMALSGSLALMGVGVLAFSAGLTLLSASVVTAAQAIITSLRILIVGIVDIVGATAESLTAAIISIANIFIESVPVIAEAIMVLGKAIIEVVVSLVPDIAAGVLKLIIGIGEALVEHVPELVGVIFDFFVEVFDKLAEKIPDLAESLAGLVTAIMTGFSEAFAKVDKSAMMDAIMTIGMLEVMMLGMAAISKVVPGAMVGVLELGVLIIELGAVLAAIGGLAQIPGLQWIIGEGGNMLETIGKAIGKFVGGIVGGVAEGTFSSLPRIGTDLSLFAGNLEPFIETMSTISGDTLSGAQTLVDLLMALTKASLLDAITNWVTGGSSLVQFAEQLVPFGEAMAKFSATVEGNVDESAVQAAANAGKMMTELADTIPNAGGVSAFFAGDNDMATFGTQMVIFGQAIAKFSELVTGNIDEAAVESAANAGKLMVELANTIPNSGGVVGFFAGNNDIATFGDQLVPFARAISEFSSTVTNGNINEEAIQAASNSGLILAELAVAVPKIGGLSQALSGEADLEGFSSKLNSFAKAIVSFSETVSGGNIDSNAIATAAKAGSALAVMANDIPNSGGLFALFSGQQDLGDFGTRLKSFGMGIKDFSDAVTGVSYADVSTGVQAGKALTELSTVTISGGIFAAGFSGANFSEQLTAFAGGIKKFAAEMSGFDGGALSTQISSLKQALTEMKSIAETGMASVNTTILDTGPKLQESMNSSLNQATMAISKKNSSFETHGQTLMTHFKSGVSSKINAPVPLMKQMVSNMVSALTDGSYNAFHSAGAQCVSGFAAGISANSFKASAAASAMAGAALASAKAKLDSHSPSREFFKIGGFTGSGFAGGMLDWIPRVKKAGTKMAQASMDGFNGVISSVAELLDGDMDMNPTVTPVVDLSNIEAGAKSVNGLFGRTSLGFSMKNLGSIGGSMNRKRGTGNSDVVDALKRLETKMEDLPGNQYTLGDITYDDGTAVADAVQSLVRATKMERRM